MAKADHTPHPGRRIDEPTGTETVGHEWDGIEELDTPMPRWWLWTLYLTIIWGVAYVILYPAWPLIEKGTHGVLGWTSRGQLAEEMASETERKAPILAALAQVPIERLPEDSVRMRAAIAGGAAAFKVNCVQCHGSGAAGSAGYPNLNDDDWLWGGDLKAIEYTITHGIRDTAGEDTRFSQMPAFGQILDAQQVARQVSAPRHGVMPAWGGRLDPVTIKMLAAYVHSLGGGEDFVEVAADPAVEVDEQP